VEIGAADPARPHAKQNFPGLGTRLGNILDSERFPGRSEDCGFQDLLTRSVFVQITYSFSIAPMLAVLNTCCVDKGMESGPA
jgi:hypothetical protein